MLLVFHILVALSSIAVTGYAFVSPSAKKLRASYGLVGLTLTSGTYLVISTHSPLLQSCVTGLVYLGIVFSGIIATHYRLEAREERIRN